MAVPSLYLLSLLPLQPSLSLLPTTLPPRSGPVLLFWRLTMHNERNHRICLYARRPITLVDIADSHTPSRAQSRQPNSAFFEHKISTKAEHSAGCRVWARLATLPTPLSSTAGPASWAGQPVPGGTRPTRSRRHMVRRAGTVCVGNILGVERLNKNI